MRLGFLNPQGNFDPTDAYWTEHPDFGGQLVYVKNVALALGALGHGVDILTRRIVDPDWPEFSEELDAYPGAPRVRILRLPMGDDDRFLPKEELWPYIGRDWVPHIEARYRDEGFPDAFTAHYGDGGLAGVLLRRSTGVPFTFTGHSLGAQKLDKLAADGTPWEELERRYRFSRRILAERAAMSHAGVIITSTEQERRDQYGHPLYAGAIDPDDDRRFIVVPPGVDLSVFGADARAPDEDAIAAKIDAAIVDRFGPERARLPIVVASSRLDPKKNLAGLVEAFGVDPELRDRANLLLITGALDDPLRHPETVGGAERAVIDDLVARIERHRLGRVVGSVGIQGQRSLAAAYRALARRGGVFALTALYEPFGLAPLEAAAAGLAVVVTRNGGPSESFSEGGREFGVLVDPTDPIDIARGIRRALDERERFAAAGRERVLARYTWDRTAEGYVEAVARASADPVDRPRIPVHPWFTDPSAPPPTVEDLRRLLEA